MNLGYPGTLHAHSDYSNLRLRDCIIKPKDLIDYAIELGHEVVGFTDHESISGAIEIEKYYEKIKEQHPNFKVIRGNEIYLCRNSLSQENFIKGEDKFYHFILLAKDAKGHKQLREISTRAWLRSWMAQKIRRVPTYYSDLQEIIGADPGHVVGSTACFLPGQKVKTLKGEKNIEDITNKDYILNSQGQWEKINYPTSRKYEGLGNILEITKEPTKIKCTANHQFLTYNYKTEQLKWVEAQNLQKQDWVLEPIIPVSYSNDEILNIEEFKSIIDYRQKSQGQNYSTNIYRLPNRIILTNEVMRLFGLWLADGHINKHEEYHKNNVGFTFSLQEFDIFYNSFVKKGLNDLGLKEQDYTINKRPENNRVDLNINKVEFCLMFYELFGISHANNKYIPDRLKHINKDFDIELFFGYFLGDGYFRYRKSQGGEIVAASISSQLIKDFEQLSNSFNLSGSITINKSHKGKDGANHQESYYLTYNNTVLGREFSKEKVITHEKLLEIITLASNKKKCYAEFINIKGVKYRVKKIKSNTTFNINEKVYCLNTDSHNFVLNNVIVHNCLGGRLPELILQGVDDDYIRQWIYNMKKIFGEEDFYLEMQPSENTEQITVNKKLYELAIETNTKFIITTDAHYLKKSDAPVHKAYLRSQNGEREVDSFYASTYMMDTEELEKYFPYFSKEKLQEGYEAIIEIKNKCEDYSLLKPLRIPELKRKEYADYSKIAPIYYNKMPSLKLFVESAHSGDRILANAIIDKLKKRPEEFDNKETYDALEVCLKSTWDSSIVNNSHWSDYYLNLQKIIDTCWEAGSLVGPGRGSGTGFLLLYVLDIIQINHLKEKIPMYPWRFLNPRRVSPLDVDFDIEGARRNQVLAKFREVYGEDRVANVITFGTEKSKSSIITAARGLGMEVEDAQYIASLVPSDRGTPRTLEQCYYGDKENGLEPVALFVKEMKNHPQLWEVAQKIQGLKCRCGIHAGGIIFVDEPFTKSTALMRAPDGTIVTAFELHDSEAVG